MRMLVTVVCAAAVSTMIACSSTDPGPGIVTPAPTQTDPTNPTPDQPQGKKEEPASRIEGLVSPALSKSLAAPDSRPVLSATDSPSRDIALCGKNTCGQGEYCCNESCGICAALHTGCSHATCSQ